MTDEQIKQNAEEYADALYDRKCQNELWRENCMAHIAGAHSRDKEIENLQIGMYGLQGSVDLWKGETGKANSKIRKLEKELNKLRNPWIKVDDEHLPKCENKTPDSLIPNHRIKSSRDVIVRCGEVINRGYYSYARERWEWNESEIKVDFWMPIPENEIK